MYAFAVGHDVTWYTVIYPTFCFDFGKHSLTELLINIQRIIGVFWYCNNIQHGENIYVRPWNQSAMSNGGYSAQIDPIMEVRIQSVFSVMVTAPGSNTASLVGFVHLDVCYFVVSGELVAAQRRKGNFQP